MAMFTIGGIRLAALRQLCLRMMHGGLFWAYARPAALCRVHRTAAEIVDFCQGKLANFKIPRYVEFVDSFPLTGSGKVQKFIQRKMAAEKSDNPSGVA